MLDKREEEEEDDDGKRRHARRSVDPSAKAPGRVSSAAHDALRGGGRPLDPRLRRFFEPRLGHDLGAVRVHTGREADASARAVAARAYTIGTDVVFRQGMFSPDTEQGQRLLAHELAHVTQGPGGERAEQGTLFLSKTGDPTEVAADRMADAAMR